MSGTSAALSSLGSDLSFAVSFAIAGEVLAAAAEAQTSDDEVVAIILVTSVVALALPRAAQVLFVELARGKNANKVPRDDGEGDGLTAFFALLFSMLQRVLLSVVVQLLAANVRAREPLRSVRILSLLALSVFFVFVSGTSAVAAK
jgi:hypothetical protein